LGVVGPRSEGRSRGAAACRRQRLESWAAAAGRPWKLDQELRACGKRERAKRVMGWTVRRVLLMRAEGEVGLEESWRRREAKQTESRERAPAGQAGLRARSRRRDEISRPPRARRAADY
jgi:hypothetical protein